MAALEKATSTPLDVGRLTTVKDMLGIEPFAERLESFIESFDPPKP